MSSSGEFAAYLPLLIGLIAMLVGLPLALKRIPPNHFYGFRTAKTRGNPDVWFSVNRVFGIDLMIAGALAIVAVPLSGMADDTHRLIISLVIVAAGLVVATVHGAMVASRLP